MSLIAPASAVSPSEQAEPGPSPWTVFRLVAIAVFLVSLDATIVLAAFPALRQAFPAVAPATLSWVLNAYTIVYAAMLVPAGRFADTHGRRKVFLSGLALFGVASALSAVAPGPVWLIIFRALQAMGAAALTPASLALILVAFPPQKRAIAVGLWGAVGALAAAFGPAVGGWLVQMAGWQSVFWVNVPIVAFAIWRGAAQLEESRSPAAETRPDVPGILLLIAAIGAIVLGLVQADRWSPALAAGTSAGGLALLGLFIVWAKGRTDAAIDLSLFREPSYAWVNAATLVFGATFSMMFLGFFLFLTGPWQLSLGIAGLMVTPGPLAVVPVAVLAGRLAGRIGHRPLLVAGGLVFAASNAWFFLRLGLTPSLPDWIVGLVLGGIGVGLVLPALSGAAVARLSPQHFGVGNAANAAMRQVGGSIGAAGTILLVGQVDAGMSQFQSMYAILLIGGLLTAVLSLKIDTRPRG